MEPLVWWAFFTVWMISSWFGAEKRFFLLPWNELFKGNLTFCGEFEPWIILCSYCLGFSKLVCRNREYIINKKKMKIWIEITSCIWHPARYSLFSHTHEQIQEIWCKVQLRQVSIKIKSIGKQVKLIRLHQTICHIKKQQMNDDNHERNENYPHDPEIYQTLMTDRSERRQIGRTRLYVSWEREVLPEGVTLEAVVGQDATEVGVVGEEHAEHVPHLCSAHTQTLWVSLCHRWATN